MTLNADKYHLLFLDTNTSICLHHYPDDTIWEENAVKLLGISIDSNNLTFNDHLKIICTAISSFCHILSENKRIILLKSFFESHQLLPIDLDVLQ